MSQANEGFYIRIFQPCHDADTGGAPMRIGCWEARLREGKPTLSNPGNDGVLIWRRQQVRDFRDVHSRVPSRGSSHAQLSRGALAVDAAVISAGGVVLYWAHVNTPMATVFDLDPAYSAFVIPTAWRQDFVINGQAVDRSSIYAPVEETVYRTRGGARETHAVGFLRKPFVETLAALKGVDPDDIRLDTGAVAVTPGAVERLRRRVAAALEDYNCTSQPFPLTPGAREKLTRDILEVVTDTYLLARPAPTRKVRTVTRLATIVRKAEERFASAEGGPVSLADLCVAANVSQGTLYHAFMAVHGDSPLAYFRKRRLTDVRSMLFGAAPGRSAIKRAALDAGLTHLGRFAAEYRDLFGESPSATLNQSAR